jgi:hypothetical protein
MPRGLKYGKATIYPAIKRLVEAFIFLILHIIICGILGFSVSVCAT